LAQERLGSVGCIDPGLAQNSTQQIDALHAGFLPAFAQFVQLLDLLLLHALDRHRVNALAASGFQNGIAIVAIGLVAPPVGADITRMQQHHRMPQPLHHPPPMVRAATGFHHPLDRTGLLLYISSECPRIEPPTPIHPTDMDTLGNLVNGLGQINCYALHGFSPS